MSRTAAGDSVVDASVLVSRLVPQDIHHQATRRWLDGLVSHGGRIIAPVLLFPEIAGAISRRTGNPALGREAVTRLQQLASIRLVAIDERLGEAATRLAADLGLRGADATYVAVAEQLSLPLLTWDNEQAERARSAIDVRAPE